LWGGGKGNGSNDTNQTGTELVFPGLPADHPDLDLLVAGEAFFEALFTFGLRVPYVVELSSSRRLSRARLSDPPRR